MTRKLANWKLAGYDVVRENSMVQTSDIQVQPQSTPRSQAVWWVIAGSLATIAVCMALRLDRPMLPVASGQTSGGAGGIFAFSAQLDNDSYGVFMVDVDTMNIWCYEYLKGGPKLRFAAARSFMYDRYLENHNCEDLSPSDVKALVEQQREQKLRSR